jgi:N-acetylglucosaminyl-diphospho-decaprenol L-rhamnosyltransferase
MAVPAVGPTTPASPGGGVQRSPRTTVVVVLYGNAVLDLSWVPAGTPVVLVHNDDATRRVSCGSGLVTHVHAPRNLGFGGGVNAALPHVRTDRVLLANPDTVLRPGHWMLLDEGGPDDVVTVPQHDDRQVPGSVVNAYPSPAVLLAQAWRLGRWFPRGGRARGLVARLLLSSGRAHVELLAPQRELEVRLPLTGYWVSGSLLSVDVERLRAVGGFSSRFFLYFEDVDLCGRLAAQFPAMRVRLRSAAGPALHSVGASAGRAGSRQVRRTRRESACAYAAERRGGLWPACRALLTATSPRGLR